MAAVVLPINTDTLKTACSKSSQQGLTRSSFFFTFFELGNIKRNKPRGGGSPSPLYLLVIVRWAWENDPWERKFFFASAREGGKDWRVKGRMQTTVTEQKRVVLCRVVLFTYGDGSFDVARGVPPCSGPSSPVLVPSELDVALWPTYCIPPVAC